MVNKIGLIGLAVMGQNLVLNMESKGFQVVVYNRSPEKTDAFMKENSGKNIEAAHSPEELIKKLEPPRVIMMMVKAGKPVDAVIEQFLPLLEKGDTLIDGGNAYFHNTEKRAIALKEKGINFLGIGISGGEEGALNGPSIMPGGDKEAYDHVKDIYEAISAKVNGEPCVTYLGPRGSGHFVKMVHNGIEYAIMQAIAEIYSLMIFQEVKYEDMQRVFKEWSESERLGGFLTEITSEVLGHVDKTTGKPFLEVVKDTAGNKGTGKWTSQTAYDLGVPENSISAALIARYQSALKDQRVQAENSISYYGSGEVSFEDMEKALYSAVVMAYSQGMHLMKTASEEYGYGLDLTAIARIWRGGCIIRSKLLEPIMNDPEGLMKNFGLQESTLGLRNTIKQAVGMGVPVPVLSASLAYYDTFRSGRLPAASMIQGLRDNFGAHTYERNDKEGIFHTNWSGDRDETSKNN